MLAKWWKKIALAICIIAILFDITYKLVHRTNLKAEIDAVRGEDPIRFSEDNRNTAVVDEGK